MTEPVAVYSLSALATGALVTLACIAAGVLLCLAGRWLTKKAPRCPRLIPFACFALGVISLAVAVFEVPSLLFAAGQLLL